MGRSGYCSSGGDSSRQSLSGSQRVCGQVTHLWALAMPTPAAAQSTPARPTASQTQGGGASTGWPGAPV